MHTCHVLDVLHVHDAHIHAGGGRRRPCSADCCICQRPGCGLQQHAALGVHDCGFVAGEPAPSSHAGLLMLPDALASFKAMQCGAGCS